MKFVKVQHKIVLDFLKTFFKEIFQFLVIVQRWLLLQQMMVLSAQQKYILKIGNGDNETDVMIK